MQFIHQPLTWGFFLVLLPLLIHLINMVRRKRVQWAAMDFLLQSYKKHRKWIWLKQFLLLMMRMIAIAVLVAMLAKWVSQGQWLDIFGGQVTHHYVLLDDSFSMSDRHGGVSAFEVGLNAVQRIGAKASNQEGRQKFTLIRYSRAERAAELIEDETGISQVLDFNGEIVGGEFDLKLEEKRNQIEITQLPVGPQAALKVVEQLIDRNRDENRIVYVVSDFRSGQWEAPEEVRAALREIQSAPAELTLVGCVKSLRQNLGITDLSPTKETRAAGVPLFVNVTVKNYGDSPVRNVQLKVRSVFYDPDTTGITTPDQLAAKVDEVPTVLIEEIEAGQSETRRVQVFYPKPGQHVVEASLPDDAVAADNRRWCVIDFPAGERVLVVDGSVDQRHAYFMETAFQPGSRAKTGIDPEFENTAFLRDVTPDVLADYRVIYLLDVPRLDDRAIENLESYVMQGGGLAFFMGPNVDYAFYNRQLYKEGIGLMPLPIEGEEFLPAESQENNPDIEIEDHPVFDVFLGERNPLIRLVTISQFLQPPATWTPEANSTVEVAARLRNRMPLAVERKYGEGRVMAFMSTLAPQWNNWGHDPTFVVVLLKLQSHLASGQKVIQPHAVGTPLAVQLEASKYRKDMQFVVPGETPDSRLVIEREAVQREQSPLLVASLGSPGTSEQLDETGKSGIYEAWPVTNEGTADVKRFAVNVEPAEGDLALVESKDLLMKLDPVKAEFRFAEEFEYDFLGPAGNERSMFLMGLLVALLLGEQALAYFASYHPSRRAAA